MINCIFNRRLVLGGKIDLQTHNTFPPLFIFSDHDKLKCRLTCRIKFIIQDMNLNLTMPSRTGTDSCCKEAGVHFSGLRYHHLQKCRPVLALSELITFSNTLKPGAAAWCKILSIHRKTEAYTKEELANELTDFSKLIWLHRYLKKKKIQF